MLADGADLLCRSRYRLAATARLAARDVFVAGRHRETGGRASSAVALDVAGEPVLRQRLDTGILDRSGRWVGWPERVAAATLLVDPDGAGAAGCSDRAVVVSPRTGVLVGSATGPTAADVCRQLREATVAGGSCWPWE